MSSSQPQRHGDQRGPARPLILRILDRYLSHGIEDDADDGFGADIVRDFEETFHEIRAQQGAAAAYLWLWRQVARRETLQLARALRGRHDLGAHVANDERHPTTPLAGTLPSNGTSARRRGTRGPAIWAAASLRRLRHAARGLALRPGFALAVIVTLALGIGANTAIFSVVDGILLEPLPYLEGHRLVFVWGAVEDDNTVLLSGPQAAEIRRLEAFSVAAQIFGFGDTSMVREEIPEPIRTLTVDYAFFDLFGVPTLLGRGFRADEEYKLSLEQIRDPSFERPIGAVVLSYGFWQQSFGGDPDVLGRVFRISGHRHEVVGVMPPGFRAWLPAELEENTPADAWIMSPFDQPSFPRDTRFVRVVGRLRDDTTLADAQGELDRLAAWQRNNFAEDARDGFHARAALLESESGATARGPLLLLLGAVGFVLLIACANVATLMLVRAAERDGEMCIRRALGASRGELADIGLAESLITATLGGLAGVALALLFTRMLIRLAPPELPRVDTIELDGSVLGFTAALTLGVALLAGLLPAWRSSRPRLVALDGRQTAARRQQWTGNMLVAAEVALAVVLVTGGGLLLRSLGNVLAVEPGFDSEGVYSWEANLTTPTHPTWESRVAYFRGVQEQLLSEPGVRSVGIMTPVPFDGADRAEIRLGMEEDARRIVADFRRTGPGALETLGIPLVRGRSLRWRDLQDFERLYAVVDRTFSEQAWPGESAVGKIISLVRREYGEGSQIWDEWKRVEVVGVAEPIRGRDVRSEDLPTVYVTYSQNMWGRPAFLVKSDTPLGARSVRQAAARADHRPLLSAFQSLDALADLRLAELRFALTLIGLFAALGLVLAATGVYGLLAYKVSLRERELHLRAALGARSGELARLVLRSGLTLTGAGILAGWLVASWLTGLLSSLLFDVTPTDPATFLAVAGFLTLVATLACWIPSRSAGRADPAAALR